MCQSSFCQEKQFNPRSTKNIPRPMFVHPGTSALSSTSKLQLYFGNYRQRLLNIPMLIGLSILSSMPTIHSGVGMLPSREFVPPSISTPHPQLTKQSNSINMYYDYLIMSMIMCFKTKDLITEFH